MSPSLEWNKEQQKTDLPVTPGITMHQIKPPPKSNPYKLAHKVPTLSSVRGKRWKFLQHASYIHTRVRYQTVVDLPPLPEPTLHKKKDATDPAPWMKHAAHRRAMEYCPYTQSAEQVDGLRYSCFDPPQPPESPI